MRLIAILFFTASFLLACQGGDSNPTPVTTPIVASIHPTAGPFNTEVTITGSNFSTTLLGNEVTVNGKAAEVISATATSLVIKVPVRAGKGKISVTTSTGSGTGPDFNFTYTVSVSTLAGQAGISGYIDGDASISKFKYPSEIKIGPDGNIFVTDRLAHCIRKVTPAGVTSTYTGQNNNPGSATGDISIATYSGPNGLCYDKNGDAYLAQVSQSDIRKITSAGIVSVFSGSGPVPGYQDGTAAQALYSSPEDCAVDDNLNVYVTEFGNHNIRKLDPSGNSITLAGNGTEGFADGTGAAARFRAPVGIFLTPNLDLIVADFGNYRIRKVTAGGVVTTIAGGDTMDFIDGPAAQARFYAPRDVAMDTDGNIYIADAGSHAIRILTTNKIVVTLAGDGLPGFANGVGSAAKFNQPWALDIDANGVIYIADNQNFLVRKMTVQ